MHTETVVITPKIAREMLTQNTSNRPVYTSRIGGLVEAFRRGEYRQTHQGIAFSNDGVLLDGQNRLMAIAQMPEKFGAPMMVTTGLDQETFLVMDAHVKRPNNHALQEADNRITQVARLICQVCMYSSSNVTSFVMRPVVNVIRYEHEALIASCSTISKSWSSAPMRLGVIVAIAEGLDPVYARKIYRAMVTLDVKNIPDAAAALMRMEACGRFKFKNTGDVIARCLIVFNPDKANSTRHKPMSPQDGNSLVRRYFGGYIPMPEQEAPLV